MLQLVSNDVRNVTMILLCNNPNPLLAFLATLINLLLCLPFPLATIAATIIVVPSAVVVVHLMPAFFGASPILGTPPFFVPRRGDGGL